jgi:DNA-binding response OmpR family regulator
LSTDDAGPNARPWRALIAVAEEPARAALVRTVSEGYAVEAVADGDAAWEAFRAQRFDLLILGRDLPGIPGTVVTQLVRQSKAGQALAIILVSPRYQADPGLGGGEVAAFGADAWLPVAPPPEVLAARVAAVLVARLPLTRFGVLPQSIAQVIGPPVQQFETMNYYQLLQVPRDADQAVVQKAFHQWSLVLHPDRHRALASRLPPLHARIVAAYRRLSEAYQVLSDDARRRTYNFGLKRGQLRFTSDTGRSHREVAACQTDEARARVLEALELRSLGDLEGALDAVQRALLVERDNIELVRMRGALVKLVEIVERGA